MEYLYKEALAVGVLPQDFWEMSAGEAEQLIMQRQKAAAEQVETQAAFVWRLGNLVRIGVNDPKKYPKLEEEFPTLFGNKNKNERKQTDWRLMKARMTAYVQAKRQVKK